jgi:hypothetical protein
VKQGRLTVKARLALAGLLVCLCIVPAAAEASGGRRTILGWPFHCSAKSSSAGHGHDRGCRLTGPVLAPVSTAVPLPSPSFFGLNEDWLYHVADVDLAREVGANAVRISLRWDSVESSRGQFDWSGYDALIAAVRAQGLRPMFTIEGSPCWARPGTPCLPTSHHPPYVRFLPAFAAFAAAAVQRYPDAIGVEIWNEPNLNEFWEPAPQPKVYARMLKLAHKAVHRVNRGMPVVFAGLVPQFGRAPRGMDARAFQQRAYRAGAVRWADAMAVHPYVYPSDDPNLIVGVRAQMAIPKTIAARFGRPGMPLWVTEFGLSTIGQGALSPDDQATKLVALYDLLRSIPGVPVLILHRLFDIDPAAAGYQAGMGLIGADGVRKPAFCALARARVGTCPD